MDFNELESALVRKVTVDYNGKTIELTCPSLADAYMVMRSFSEALEKLKEEPELRTVADNLLTNSKIQSVAEDAVRLCLDRDANGNLPTERLVRNLAWDGVNRELSLVARKAMELCGIPLVEETEEDADANADFA